jgi:predicted transcriptional regulator of viral defense system
MARSTRESARTLSALAQSQGGYFTAKQAREAGYDYPHIEYHESTGTFEWVEHGLYRLPTVPPIEHDGFIRLSLWSRNRAEEPQAVVSHESALILHDLSELLPRKIHLPVPPTFRKPAPEGVVLHKAKLQGDEVEEREGFRVTTALRTLLDSVASRVSDEQLQKAVAEALSRGLVGRRALSAAARASPGAGRLLTALGRGAKVSV